MLIRAKSGFPAVDDQCVYCRRKFFTDWLRERCTQISCLVYYGKSTVSWIYFYDSWAKTRYANIFPGVKNLDFVCAWYKKASDYIRVRRYVPMGFIKAGTIVTDRVQVIPDASLYDFGIIISNIHMAWMRVTCMRLKSDYSYSKDVVYNNFPWPVPIEQRREKIEKTAQAILVQEHCIQIAVLQRCMMN